MSHSDARADTGECSVTVTYLRGSHTLTDYADSEVAGIVCRYSWGIINVWTTYITTSVYGRSKLLHALRHNGLPLSRADGLTLYVDAYVSFPVDHVTSDGEIYTAERVVLLCDDQSRYYVDDESVVSTLLHVLITECDVSEEPACVEVSVKRDVIPHRVEVLVYGEQ